MGKIEISEKLLQNMIDFIKYTMGESKESPKLLHELNALKKKDIKIKGLLTDIPLPQCEKEEFTHIGVSLLNLTYEDNLRIWKIFSLGDSIKVTIENV